MPQVSVIIPTHARPQKLGACLSRLAVQSLPADDYEVLVGIDGGVDRGAVTENNRLRAAWIDAGGHADGLCIASFPRLGQAGVRNALLENARGDVVVFLNDDMLPAHGLLEEHLRSQRAEIENGAVSLVIGSAPWVVHAPDTLFARLIRETSMVFFYDQMTPDDPDHDWGFRHAWTLNLSAPLRYVREAGGFSIFPSTYGFEDDELAYRMAQRFGARVLYRPGACAHHDHRLSLDDYLEREERLGNSAWGFATAAPECARAVFDRDITSDDEVRYCQEYVAREAKACDRIYDTLKRLESTPSDAIDGTDTRLMLKALYEQHLPLKRLRWRCGLLRAWADAQRRCPGTAGAPAPPVTRPVRAAPTSPADASRS